MKLPDLTPLQREVFSAALEVPGRTLHEIAQRIATTPDRVNRAVSTLTRHALVTVRVGEVGDPTRPWSAHPTLHVLPAPEATA